MASVLLPLAAWNGPQAALENSSALGFESRTVSNSYMRSSFLIESSYSVVLSVTLIVLFSQFTPNILVFSLHAYSLCALGYLGALGALNVLAVSPLAIGADLGLALEIASYCPESKLMWQWEIQTQTRF